MSTEIELIDYNPKNESILDKLKEKLFSGTDSGEIIYDLNGNEVGNLSNGKLSIEGRTVSNKVFFDEE